MPIMEADPWREQYFGGVPCPPDVRVPTEDADSYLMYPRQRWVYNKLLICETQGLAHGPHGIAPPAFPVFSKPIYNLRGMGIGSRVVNSLAEYRAHQQPGHMWMQLLAGEHVSTDVAVVAGEPVWWRHVVGRPLPAGTFDYWTILADAKPELEAYCAAWLCRHFDDYTGMVNLETVGGKIIEAHLRFSDQWPDLYGPGWVAGVVGLYRDGGWRFVDDRRRLGYSVVLFGDHGRRYRHPPAGAIAAILRDPAVSSVQITFHADRDPASHAMPPGGFRLAIVNCWDLAAGFAARIQLAEEFAAQDRARPKLAGGKTGRIGR